MKEISRSEWDLRGVKEWSRCQGVLASAEVLARNVMLVSEERLEWAVMVACSPTSVSPKLNSQHRHMNRWVVQRCARVGGAKEYSVCEGIMEV